LVVTGDYEDACYCHNHKCCGVTASKDEEHDGKQHRKAHRCHRHESNGEKNDYEDSKTDKSCAPIDEPYACKEGHNSLTALKIIPHGECVTEHTAKKCRGCTKLCSVIEMPHYKSCGKHGENGFANVDSHNAKGCGGKSVKSLEIGKAGVFTTKLTDILAINQARKDNGTIDAPQEVSKSGKG